MAATQFKMAGHPRRVFNYCQAHPGEWLHSVAVAKALGVTPGRISPAIQTLERENYIIRRRVSDKKNRDQTWIRSVDEPGKPSCARCGKRLSKGRFVACAECVPYEPREPHHDVQNGSEAKVAILAERYAQGLPLWIEEDERNYRRGL